MKYILHCIMKVLKQTGMTHNTNYMVNKTKYKLYV